MKLGFFLREAIRALKRNAVPSFAAMATVVVTVLVLGVFIPVVQATNDTTDKVRSRIVTSVFLKRGATKQDINRVKYLLKNKTKHVKSVQFISKEQGYKEDKKKNPTFYKGLGSYNPLPDKFWVTPDNPENITKIRDALTPKSPAGNRTVIDPAIDEVKNNQAVAGKVATGTRLIKWTMGGLTLLLVIASVLLISNTIRLSLFARRREVEVMKLVGATDWFIRWPFVLEGILVGTIGGTIAIGLLTIMKFSLIDPLSSKFALIDVPETMGFIPLVVLLLASSIAVSAIGSGLSLRRFLRV